jgi:hypothetical protein
MRVVERKGAWFLVDYAGGMIRLKWQMAAAAAQPTEPELDPVLRQAHSHLFKLIAFYLAFLSLFYLVM